mgnify:CR=1
MFFYTVNRRRDTGNVTPWSAQTASKNRAVTSNVNGNLYSRPIYGAAQLSQTARPVRGDK